MPLETCGSERACPRHVPHPIWTASRTQRRQGRHVVNREPTAPAYRPVRAEPKLASGPSDRRGPPILRQSVRRHREDMRARRARAPGTTGRRGLPSGRHRAPTDRRSSSRPASGPQPRPPSGTAPRRAAPRSGLDPSSRCTDPFAGTGRRDRTGLATRQITCVSSERYRYPCDRRDAFREIAGKSQDRHAGIVTVSPKNYSLRMKPTVAGRSARRRIR